MAYLAQVPALLAALSPYNNHITVYLILAAFLASTILIGWRAGRGIQHIQDYATAKRSFTTVALVLTYLATEIGGGSIFGDVREVFSQGVIMTLALTGLMVTYLIRACFIAPRMGHFQHAMTMGDLVAELYGKAAGVLTGILSVLYALAVVGLQLTALGTVLENLLGIQATWGIFIASLILAAYSAYGGIRAVTATDVLQFLVLIIIFPLIAFLLLNQVGGMQALLSQVPAERWQVWTHPNASFYLTLFLIWALFSIEMIDPAIMQRMLLARKGRQLRNQFLAVAGVDLAFRLIILLIALAALVVYPCLEPQQVMTHLIGEFLPVGVKGLAIAGCLAVTMSTADSYLHVGGLALAHDVLRPLLGSNKVADKELSWARYSTLLIGLLAPIIALQNLSLLGLNFLALSITGPMLGIPLIAGILGLKPNKHAFYGAMAGALAVFMACELWLTPEHAHLSTLWSIVANGIIFLALHRIRNKGWKLADHSQGQGNGLEKPKKPRLDRWIQCIPTPERILQYSQRKVSQYGAPYILFGVFFTINAIVPFFLWGYTDSQGLGCMLLVRFIGACLCVLLIVQEKWPQALLHYMPTFWHLTILYCLPFTSTMMCLLTHGSTEWLINIAIVIILLFLLLDWISALGIGLIGVALGWIVYSYWVGRVALSLDTNAQYLLVYQIVFGLLVGLVFARRRAYSFDWLQLSRAYLAKRQAERGRDLVEALNCREELLKELDPEVVSLFQSSVQDYIKQAIYRVRDYMRLEVSKLRLDQLLQEVRYMLELEGMAGQPELVIKKHTEHEAIQADGAKLKQLLVNSMIDLHRHSAAHVPITIGLQDATLGHSIAHMPGYARRLRALKITITTEAELPTSEPLYMIDAAKSSIGVPQDAADLSLRENARIIDAHYGYLDVRQPTTHVYVIPVNVREIRGKVMELLREPAAADPEELQHPLAIQLEEELLDKLRGTGVDLQVIHKALKLIKQYHGGVKRKSGEPFFTHPLSVALILLKHSQDQEAILAALLHDTVEDTSLSLAHIRVMFGERVAFLVGKATNLEDSIRRLSLAAHETLSRLIHYEDPCAALVKLSDRLHNMRTIRGHRSLEKQRRIAKETLTFFVPLARHLGLVSMGAELEKLSLAVLGQ